MPIRIVQSKQNARLKELRKSLAYPGRESRGLAGIEGPNLLKEALRAGLRIDCVFAAQGTDAMREVLALPPETEILVLPKELLDSALTTEAPQSIAALVEPPDWTWAHIVGTHGTDRDRARRARDLLRLHQAHTVQTRLRAQGRVRHCDQHQTQVPRAHRGRQRGHGQLDPACRQVGPRDHGNRIAGPADPFRRHAEDPPADLPRRQLVHRTRSEEPI